MSQEKRTHLIAALVAYLNAPIEASLVGLHTLCDGGRHHEYFKTVFISSFSVHLVFQSQANVKSTFNSNPHDWQLSINSRLLVDSANYSLLLLLLFSLCPQKGQGIQSSTSSLLLQTTYVSLAHSLNCYKQVLKCFFFPLSLTIGICHTNTSKPCDRLINRELTRVLMTASVYHLLDEPVNKYVYIYSTVFVNYSPYR